MTTKVLLDPIYSAMPSRCSSATKVKKMVEDTLKVREDVFFYWLIPDYMFKEDDATLKEFAWLPKHDNIRYIPFDYSKDRMKAYRTLPDELVQLIAFDGELWDTDLVITMRAMLVPNMKILMTSPRQTKADYLKKVLVFEEMPVMDFKPTVAVSCADIQDRETVSGYLAADWVLITIDYEKQGILRGALETYQPTVVRELDRKVTVANPATNVFWDSKAPEHRFKGDRPFCIGHVGRMGNMERLEDVYEVMEKHWITKGAARIRALFTTVTTGIKKTPPDFVEVQHPPREQFHKILKEEMDLVYYLSPEGGFGLGFFEVLFFGVPMLVTRKPWTESLLGKDYPFFATSVQEVYAMTKIWYEDYEGQYARFREWVDTKLKARFEKGGIYERSYYDEVQIAIDCTNQVTSQFKEKSPGKKNMLLAREVDRYVQGKDEFILKDVLIRLTHDKVLSSKIEEKLNEPDNFGVVWATPWNEVRQVLKAFYGWEDASPAVGHFRRTNV